MRDKFCLFSPIRLAFIHTFLVGVLRSLKMNTGMQAQLQPWLWEDEQPGSNVSADMGATTLIGISGISILMSPCFWHKYSCKLNVCIKRLNQTKICFFCIFCCIFKIFPDTGYHIISCNFSLSHKRRVICQYPIWCCTMHSWSPSDRKVPILCINTGDGDCGHHVHHHLINTFVCQE